MWSGPTLLAVKLFLRLLWTDVLVMMIGCWCLCCLPLAGQIWAGCLHDAKLMVLLSHLIFQVCFQSNTLTKLELCPHFFQFFKQLKLVLWIKYADTFSPKSGGIKIKQLEFLHHPVFKCGTWSLKKRGVLESWSGGTWKQFTTSLRLRYFWRDMIYQRWVTLLWIFFRIKHWKNCTDPRHKPSPLYISSKYFLGKFSVFCSAFTVGTVKWPLQNQYKGHMQDVALEITQEHLLRNKIKK